MACVVFYLDDGSSHVVNLDDSEVITVGRHPDSLVTLTNPSVSSHHATIKKRDKGFFVADLGSSNGTRLNGAEIEEALLRDGDRVAFGDVQAVFYVGGAPVAAPPPDEPAKKVVFVPRPEIPSEPPPPPPPVGLPSVPAPRSRFGRSVAAPRTSSGYPDQSGGGCATALFLTALFVTAFFVGLTLRHMKETDRSLMSDLIERITRELPKVKIEQ